MQGQINRGSKLGEIIFNLCKQTDVKTIVDIGTWNGMGTTKCIRDAVLERDSEWLVYSIESSPSQYQQAVNNLPKLENFNLLLGRIIDNEELVNIDQCDEKFFNGSLGLGAFGRGVQKSWLAEDVNNYNTVPNVLALLPEKIDLLILDGGEYSSLAEFHKLKDRTTYFVLDDTVPIKNNEVSQIMRESADYEVLYDEPNDRNGFLVAKKLS